MDRALLVAIGFLAGVIVGGFAVGYLIPAETDLGGTDGSPPYSYSVGTTDQIDSALDRDGGWLHEVHVRDGIVVTGNATMVHDGDQTVRLNVTRMAPGTYEFAFETVPREDDAKGTEGMAASTLEWGVDLPMDYDSYVITVDGTVEKRVENDEATTARLMELPHPLAE